MGNCLCGKDEEEVESKIPQKQMNPVEALRTEEVNSTRYTYSPNGQPIGQAHRVDVIRTPSQAHAFVRHQLQLIGGKVVVALYNYTACDVQDLSFRKGDRLLVLDDKPDSDSDWWKARHLGNFNEGYIPRNFVARERSIESEEWFFGKILRKDAEKQLLMPQNPRGTFLIRNSEQSSGVFSLSVKDWENGRGDHVKHYKIKCLDNGSFFITPRHVFLGLQDLVAFYIEDSNGLCHRLTFSCPKPKPHMWDLSPETRDKWEIDPLELEFVKKLGGGNFGEVSYGKWKGKIDVAIKSLKPGTMSSEAFLEEAKIMKTFRHEKLVSLYAVCSRQEPFYIVTEFMCHGSLLEYLRNGTGRSLRLHHLIDMAAQIGAGMMYLEEKQLVHRDLAARNILVNDENVVKIADFGLARIIEDSEYTARQGAKFPVKWTAPEAVLYGRFTIKSDVWSYGILLMELMTFGQVPYPGMNNREVIDLVEKGYRMPKPTLYECPDPAYDVMIQCWDPIPDQRPTFEYLFTFFDDFPIATEPRYKDAEEFN